MRFRVAGVSDLIAAKGERCLSAYIKVSHWQRQKYSQKGDIDMIFICSDLHYVAERNQILQLSDVQVRYNKLAQPIHKYCSRLSFDEKFIKKVGDLFYFVQPLICDILDRDPLLASRKYCHEIIADSFCQSNETANDDEMLTMPQPLCFTRRRFLVVDSCRVKTQIREHKTQSCL